MTIATKPSRKDYMTAKPSRLDYSKPSRKEYTVGVGPMWDEPGDTRTMRERLGYEKKKPITAGDAAQAVTETPENLWIGTVGMSASVLEAIKREGMRYAGGGILPDENVRRQFEAVTPPDVLPSTGQPLPGAITAEAFGLITRLPDVGAKIVRDYQQEKMKDQVTLDDAPITKLARLVTQSGIPSMSVALGISVLTRNPIAGLGILGTIEGGAAFENQLQEGGSIRKSMLIGDLSAAAEIGGEMLVFPKFVKGLKTGIPLDKALKLIVENAGQEGATGFTQRFLEVFGTETTKGTDITDAARIAFNEGVKAVPENAWVGGVTAGLVDLVSTGTSRILRDPDLKNKIEKKIGASPKVAARAVQMLDEGWTPAEIDRNLITPSKFLGDRAIDQIQAKERLKTEEDRQVEKDITEMDRELAEIQGQTLAETPATRGIEGPDITQERLLAAEGVEIAPEAVEAKPEVSVKKQSSQELARRYKELTSQIHEMVQAGDWDALEKWGEKYNVEHLNIYRELQNRDVLPETTETTQEDINRARIHLEEIERRKAEAKPAAKAEGVEVAEIDGIKTPVQIIPKEAFVPVFKGGDAMSTEKTLQNLPPVQEGYIRLYRGQHPTEHKDLFHPKRGVLTDKEIQEIYGIEKGGWFTPLLNYAINYAEAQGKGAEIAYIDLPQDVANKYAQGADEYFFPQLRDAAKPAAKAEPAKIKTSVGTIEIPKSELDVKWDKALEVIFDYGNQDAADRPLQPGLARSLSMGDTVEYEGKTWLVMPTGWQDVSQLSQEQIDKIVGEAKITIPTKAHPPAAEGRKARNVATGELMDLKVGDPYVDNMAVDVVAFQPFTIEGEQGAFPEGAIEVEEIGEILEAGQVIVNKRPATKSEIETRLARERKNKAVAEKLGVDTESYEKEIQRLEKALSEGKYAHPPAKEALAKAPKAEKVSIDKNLIKNWLPKIKTKLIEEQAKNLSDAELKRAFKGTVAENRLIEYSQLMRESGDLKYEDIRAEKVVEPEAKIEEPDKYREELIKKWGEEKFDKVWFELAEGGENERFSDIDSRVAELDEQDKFDSPEAKRLRIEMDSIVDAELEKRAAELTQPPEKPSELTKPAETAPKVTGTEEVTDEELGGITKRERRRLIKENAAKIEQSDIYQNEVAAMETMATEVGAGYYYIDKGYRGEVEAIIGKRKGFPTAIQRMFTFNPDEKRIITLPDGNKAAVGPTPWERSVQEGLGRYKEGVDQTWGEMDISEFVQRVVDAYNAYEKIGGVYKGPLERTEESGRPDEQMLAEKHRMLVAGISDHEINKMITEWAEEWGIAIEDIEDEFINEYGTRIRQIKRMEDPDAALEQLAAEQIEREDRQAAADAAREVLEANDIQAEVKEVEGISERPIDLIGRPLLQGGAAGKQRGLGELGLEFTKPEVKDPDQLEFGQLPKKPEDDIPFERRGRPVGAAITQGQKQVILLAYGADSETGYHEGYHILRRRLNDKDTRVLEKYFKGDEEAEARAFAEFAKTGKTRTFMRGIWQKLRNVLRKVKSGMMGRGFRTADDIFAGIRSGKIEKAPAKGGVAFETSGEKARREVEKRARIKARAARIAADNKIKTKKKAKAPRIKLNIRDVTPLLGKEYQEGAPRYRRKEPPLKIPIKDVTPALTADLALAEKGIAMEPSEERPLTTKPTVETVYDEKWFQANLKKERRSVLDRGSSEAKSAWLGAEKIFSPISTRLNNIAPKLFRETRQFVYNYLTRSTGMIEDVKGFVNATRKMSKEDWRMLDLALKNGVKWKTDEIVGKYGLTEEYNNVRDTLDEIFAAAKEVGIDIEYMKNYWPRVLKDPEGFLMYFQGREDWSIIEEAIKRRAKQAGRKVEDLTVDEKAHVINTLLRGFQTQALTLSRPGAAKERTVETVHKEIDAFYADSRSAIYRYIKIMNAKIAEREFFGRETKQIQALRKTQSARLTRLMKLKRRVGLKYPSEPKYKEHISRTAQAWKDGQERLERLKARPMSETIGGYVMRLQAAGEISPTQEKEVQDLLRAIFDPKRMGKRMSMFAAGVYIDTLNSPLQAMTQLDEFAYSFYRSPLRSIPVAIRTAARKSKITPRDIGITSIGEEFQGPSMQRALSLLLKSTGFETIDRLNKENYINTVLSKYQAQAKRKNLNAYFLNRIRKVFGDDYKGVLEDLRNNRISDNVKYLLFNEILDIQPVAITEMPEYYNRAGNLRILYALKTFYIRRLDFIRNECFKDMKSSKTFARGFGKLVWLAGSFALMGAGSDFLKDFIRGKPFDIKDSIADNMLRMAFFSKYQAWLTREKGLGTALLEGWRPPTKAIDALTRDIINEAQGKERGWELWRSVPIVGEEYYWWFGEGRRKIEKKQKKSPVD